MTNFINWLEGYLEDKLTKEQIERIKEKYSKEIHVTPIGGYPPHNDWSPGDYPPYNPFPINTPCRGGCTYPNPWFGIVPPNCLKCDKQCDQGTIWSSQVTSNNTIVNEDTSLKS